MVLRLMRGQPLKCRSGGITAKIQSLQRLGEAHRVSTVVTLRGLDRMLGIVESSG
jgi:hypothetical protein